MEIHNKKIRIFQSQKTQRQLQVVKPYWVARNYIPPPMHDKCQGHHGLLKLPLIQHFLKKGQTKLFTEQNVNRTQQNHDAQYWKQHQNSSQSNSQDHNNLEEIDRLKFKRHHNKHKSTVQEIVSVNKKDHNRFKSMNINFCENQIGKQKLIDSFQKKDIVEPRNSGRDDYLQIKSKFYEKKRIQFESPEFLNRSKLIKPAFLTQHFKQTKGQATSKDKLSHFSNYNKQSNSRKYKQSLRFPSILNKHELSFSQNSPIQSFMIQYNKSGLIQQFKQNANILQNILNNQQKPKEKEKYSPSKKIMSLMATLDIIKDDLQTQDVKIVLKNYLPQSQWKTVQQIEKVLSKSVEYREILNLVKQKLHISRIVPKKIQQKQNKQETDQLLEKRRRKKNNKIIIYSQNSKQNIQQITGNKQTSGTGYNVKDHGSNDYYSIPSEQNILQYLNKGGNQNRDHDTNRQKNRQFQLSAVGQIKGKGQDGKNKYSSKKQFQKHQRYMSDNNMLNRKNLKKQVALTNIENKKQKLLKKQLKGKNGKTILNQQVISSIKSKKNKKIDSLKAHQNTRETNEKNPESKLSKLSSAKKKYIKSNLKDKLQVPILSTEILQKIRKNNRRNAKRSLTHRDSKSKRQSKNRLFQQYGSEKMLKPFEMRTIRKSFAKLLPPHNDSSSKTMSNIQSRINSKINSKLQSHLTTPQLLMEIQDSTITTNTIENDVAKRNFQIGHAYFRKNRQINGCKMSNNVSIDSEQQNYNSQFNYKSKIKGKINRFQYGFHDGINFPKQSLEHYEEEQQISQLAPSKKSKKQYTNEEPDWQGIIKRIPKKKSRPRRNSKNTKNQKKRKLIMIETINTKLMQDLHRQMYRILQQRPIPQLQQIRQILLWNQKRIKEQKLKQQYIGQQYFVQNSRWIENLDFGVNIKTNNRQHLGSSRSPTMIIIRYNNENDSVDLYQIACRESQVVDKLQEKERIKMFASQSIHLTERLKSNENMVSYGF